MKLFFLISACLVALYLLIVLLLYLFQERLIFPGDKLPENFTFRNLPGLHETTVTVDGAVLSALHFKNENPRGLIFFLHGNAGNLHDWVPDVDFYRAERYDLFMIDYRGYGKSTGKINSQQQLEEDVLIAWEQASADYKEKALPIVIYGRSLGTYLASNLARATNADLLVLVSPYTSVQAMAKRGFPFIPVWALRYPLATDRIIDQIAIPVLILHGDQDALIPIAHAESLYKQALAEDLDANFKPVTGAAHNDIHSFSEYNDTLAAALPKTRIATQQ